MQVVRPYMIHGGQYAVEDVVAAPVLPAPFDGDHVPGVGHHADGGVVPLGVGTDGAQAPGGQILADGTQRHAALGIGDGVGKGLRLLGGQAQHMERQPLGGLVAHAGQLGKLFHQLFQWGGEVFHGDQPLSAAMAAGMSAALYTAEPATSTLAPAAMQSLRVWVSTPPSTSSSQPGFMASM